MVMVANFSIYECLAVCIRSGSFFFCLICCYFFLFSLCNEIWHIKSDFYNVTGSHVESHIKGWKRKKKGKRRRERGREK